MLGENGLLSFLGFKGLKGCHGQGKTKIFQGQGKVTEFFKRKEVENKEKTIDGKSGNF